MRFSARLSFPSRLTSLVKHAYQKSAVPVFVMDILVRIPFLLNLSEHVQRNTKIMELPCHKRKSFSTYFHLQKSRKRRYDRQYQEELYEEKCILLHRIGFNVPYLIICFHRRQCVAARDQWD